MAQDLAPTASAKLSAEFGKRRGVSARRSPTIDKIKEWTRIWAIGFVLWTVLAFLGAAGTHVYTASVGGPESWAQLLAWYMTISAVWSVMTPPVYALSRRFMFERSNWKMMLPLHIVASIVLTCIAASIIVWLEPYVTWTPEAHVPFFAHMLSRAFMDLQRYWYILLITQAIDYYGKYRERELQSSQLEAQLAHAQLEVLKIQLEPHFLFNTLNSIAALARNDGPAAEHMTLQLADLLRFSLDAMGVHEVPLSRELTILQKYIDIQQTRFQDRLQVEMDIAGNTLSALVPNMILQPLVENAIRHGIGPRRAPGVIRICTRQVFDELWMEIGDNGMGLTRFGGMIPPEGVGLRNTRARLLQLYNHDHR
ncbi:MAG: histidine kinase, partial [Candidatus Korobacteraceae bacterium]